MRPERPLAVFDVGSNSGRAIVVRLVASRHLEILSDARSSLRLVTEVDRDGRLSAAALDRTVLTLRDFVSIAAGAGARRTVAVATAAVREATNRREFVAAIKRYTGVELRVLEGDEEARYAFLGAVHGLPVDSGMLVDVGGGSTELTRFVNRRAVQGWTLPLGALRMTGRFLSADPPKSAEIARLVTHVHAAIEEAAIPAMRNGDVLVGTGGTIRNLAKAHRAPRNYPIPRLHGYAMSRGDVSEITNTIAGSKTARLATMRGLSEDRADSIAGGALVTDTIMELLGAKELLTSGQGLREGIALEAFHDGLAPVRATRRVAVDALSARFTGWSLARARRRAQIVQCIVDGIGGELPENGREMLGHAAWVLDIGRSIDFYERFEHTATIVAASDLRGFSHRDIAMLAAIIREAGGDLPSLRVYAQLLDANDRAFVERSGVMLKLADEIERRLPAGAPPQTTVTARKQTITLSAPMSSQWQPGPLADRFHKVLRRTLVVTPAVR